MNTYINVKILSSIAFSNGFKLKNVWNFFIILMLQVIKHYIKFNVIEFGWGTGIQSTLIVENGKVSS